MQKHSHSVEIHACVGPTIALKGGRAPCPLRLCNVTEVGSLRIFVSYHAFPSPMAVLGSVFDEEDVGDVKNAPTLTLLRHKISRDPYVNADAAICHTRMSPISIYDSNR